MTNHTPGPWSVSCVRTKLNGEPVLQILGTDQKVYALVFYSDRKPGEHAASYADANLIAAAPAMLAALQKVNKLISEAAMTGFNCHDWAERLFFSQQDTSAAIKQATGGLKP